MSLESKVNIVGSAKIKGTYTILITTHFQK